MGPSIRILTILAVSLPLAAAEFFVSPRGTPVGDGSVDRPWDFQTALNHPAAVRPGDTIWLRGGLYSGTFTSRLSGSAANPIVVRSYPGEWAKVDGAGSTVLLNGLPSSGNATCTFPAYPPLNEGSTLKIDGEQVLLNNRSGNSFTCIRGWNGTPVGPHGGGTAAQRIGNIIETTGGYVWWWGFEITSSRPERMVASEMRGAGLNFTSEGQGNKAINMVIHDVGHPAIGFWNQSDGGEIYGSIMWGNGIYDPEFGDRTRLNSMSRGSAVYAENTVGTVTIADTISFRNVTNSLHVSTTNGAADNFVVNGNVSFENASGELFANGGDVNPQKNLQVTGNFTYVSAASGTNAARMGYGLQHDMVFQDNYLVGGENPALLVNNWTGQIRITGNTIVGRTALLSYAPDRARATWDANTYFTTGSPDAFGFGGRVRSFEDWQRLTGFDAHSKFMADRPPDAVFIRPNRYEPGRAHLVIYNWSLADSVRVNLSTVLATGSRYEIRDVQNFFGPAALEGVFNGEPVEIPLRARAAAGLAGDLPTVSGAHTLPEFGVFLVTSRGEERRVPRSLNTGGELMLRR